MIGRLFAAALLALALFIVVDTLATDHSALWFAIGGCALAVSIAIAAGELRARR